MSRDEQDLRVAVTKLEGSIGLLNAQIEAQNKLMKASQLQQEELNKELKKRLIKQENCPCQVRRDESFECPLMNLRLMVAKYVGVGVGVGFVLQIVAQIVINLYFGKG